MVFNYHNPRFKMLVLNAALLGSLVFVVYASLRNATEVVMLDYIKGVATAVTIDVAERATNAMETNTSADAERIIEQTLHWPGVIHVALYRADASVFLDMGQPLNWRPAFNLPLPTQPYYQSVGSQLHVVVPVLKADGPQGAQMGFAHVSVRNDEAARIFSRVSTQTIIAALFVLFVFIVYGALQITRIFRDIERDRLTLSSTAQVADFERSQSLKSLESNREILRTMNQEAEKIYQDITREIHDQLGAQLVDARANIIEARRLTDTLPETPETDQIVERLDHTREQISDTYLRLRDIVNRLRPDILDMLGLSGGIKDYARGWAERGNYALEVDIDGDIDHLPDEVNMTIYRVVQEALTNITKHAHAKRVDIRIARSMDSGKDMLTLSIVDDGVGFPKDGVSTRQGIGLRGMNERVVALGGQIFFDRGVNGLGARVEATIPIPASNRPVVSA